MLFTDERPRDWAVNSGNKKMVGSPPFEAIEMSSVSPLDSTRSRNLTHAQHQFIRAKSMESQTKTTSVRFSPEQLADIMEENEARRSSTMVMTYEKLFAMILPKRQKDEITSRYMKYMTFCPPPIFVILMSLIQIGVFFYYQYTNPLRGFAEGSVVEGCNGCFADSQQTRPSLFIFVPNRRYELWRWLSYQLVHDGHGHLWPNIIMQLTLGLPLEAVHKGYRVIPIYQVGVLFGCLIQYAWNSNTALIGASAGVYALILAHGANIFLNWKEMEQRYIWLAVFTVFITQDVGRVLVTRWWYNQCDMISHGAHFGGAVSGFLLGYCWLLNIRRHRQEIILQGVFWILLLAISIFLIVYAIRTEPDFKQPISDCVLTSSRMWPFQRSNTSFHLPGTL